jgi:hypothetical protein
VTPGISTSSGCATIWVGWTWRVELPSVDRLLGRETVRPSAFPIRSAMVAGLGVVIAGAVLGGLAAYFFQPGAGERRRAAARKQVRRVLRKIKRTLKGG